MQIRAKGPVMWWFRLLLYILIAVAAIGLDRAITPCAYGHDANSPFADWFNSRKEPDNPHVSCCGISDSFDVDEYFPDSFGGILARVGSEWYEVPPEKIGWADVNPTGHGIIYLSQSEWGYKADVLCFFPAAGV